MLFNLVTFMSNSNQNILKETNNIDSLAEDCHGKLNDSSSTYSKNNESIESLCIINSNPKEAINLKFENELDLTISNLEDKIDKKLSIKQDREDAIEQSFNTQEVQGACTMISEFIYDLLLECKDKLQSKSNENNNTPNIPVFYGRVPNYTVEEYMLRIVKYAILDENEILFIAMILKALKNKDILIEISNIYKLINGSLMLTIKYLKDKKFKIQDYARITGETIHDLFSLEYNVLAILDFNLFKLDKNFQSFRDEFYDEYSQYI